MMVGFAYSVSMTSCVVLFFLSRKEKQKYRSLLQNVSYNPGNVGKRKINVFLQDQTLQ